MHVGLFLVHEMIRREWLLNDRIMLQRTNSQGVYYQHCNPINTPLSSPRVCAGDENILPYRARYCAHVSRPHRAGIADEVAGGGFARSRSFISHRCSALVPPLNMAPFKLWCRLICPSKIVPEMNCCCYCWRKLLMFPLLWDMLGRWCRGTSPRMTTCRWVVCPMPLVFMPGSNGVFLMPSPQ